MSSIDDKVLNKIRKIKELADRGVGGEKVTAEALLKKYADKYGVTLEDLLLDEKREKYEFHIINKYYRELLHQIISMVCDLTSIEYWMPSSRSRTKESFMLTKLEYEEISSIYSQLIPKLDEEFAITTSAFVQANGLYPSKSSDGEKKMPTREELKLWAAISARAGNMERSYFKNSELIEQK